MRRIHRTVLSGMLCLGGTACIMDPIACTDQLNSTIIVQVRDAKTGEPVGIGTTVIVRGGTVYDSTTSSPPALFGDSTIAYIAWENHVPGGAYTVTVRRAGYATWLKIVTVPKDRCHSGPGPSVDVRLNRFVFP